MIDNTMKAAREKARKAKNVWYAWYPGDYASKTATLTLVEHGAYRVLLDLYYQMNGSMVANATLLLRACRAVDSAEQAAVHDMLARFFVERDGYYHHERADAELDKRALLREKRAQAGSKGGKQKVANATNLLAVGNGACQTQLQSQSHKKETEAKASEPVGSPAPVIELAVPKAEQEQPKVAPAVKPIDLEAQVWAVGKAYLIENGVSVAGAGGLIGKWRKQLGNDDLEVMRVLRRAQAECVSAPVPFIERCIQNQLSQKGNSNGRSNGRSEGQSGSVADIADIWLERGGFAARSEREIARH